MIRSERLKAIMAAVARPRVRNPLVVAGSLLAHAVVLGLLATGTFKPLSTADAGPPLIYLQIEPRPLLRDEAQRERPPSRLAIEAPSARSPASRPMPPRPDDDEESALDPRSVIPGVPSRAATGETWLVRPETERGRVARSLRTSTMGCNARNGRMSEAEQALCDEAFNEGAARARPISGTDNPGRDARFAAEGRREMQAYEARRRPLAGGTGVTGVGDCPGSNFGIGCPGAHLDPGFRQDNLDTLDEGLRDRGRERRPE